MVKVRCDAVLIQIVATEVDEHGRPIGEVTSQPTKVFRASTPDFWAAVDKAVEAMQRQQAKSPAPPTPAPPAVRRGRKR